MIWPERYDPEHGEIDRKISISFGGAWGLPTSWETNSEWEKSFWCFGQCGQQSQLSHLAMQFVPVVTRQENCG